jgi:hypothetical protein
LFRCCSCYYCCCPAPCTVFRRGVRFGYGRASTGLQDEAVGNSPPVTLDVSQCSPARLPIYSTGPSPTRAAPSRTHSRRFAAPWPCWHTAHSLPQGETQLNLFPTAFPSSGPGFALSLAVRTRQLAHSLDDGGTTSVSYYVLEYTLASMDSVEPLPNAGSPPGPKQAPSPTSGSKGDQPSQPPKKATARKRTKTGCLSESGRVL